MSVLFDKQTTFARAAATLILQAHALGYQVTIGHAMRCENCVTGKPQSNHKIKLAIDLNLFRDGEYLADTEHHRPLGEWWKATWGHLGAVWGGDFLDEKGRPTGDGNHYSFEHQGRK